MKKRAAALLLTVLLLLSLLVVAEADTAVILSIEPQAFTPGAAEVLFDVYLDPNGEKEIGAFQFSVTGQNCTITGTTYTNSALAFDETTGSGAFAYFGGSLQDGVYTFAAAGTSKTAYTVEGISYPAHIWNAGEKTKLVTIRATVNSGADGCQLVVSRSGDKKAVVGRNSGADGIHDYYEVDVRSWLAHAHTYKKVEAAAATCGQDGNTAYYTCTCGKYFVLTGTSYTETTEDAVIISMGTVRHDLQPVARVDTTGTRDGMEAHYKCAVCGKLFTDAEGTDETTAAALKIPNELDAVSQDEATRNEQLDKAAHTFGVWIIDQPATATTSGLRHATCIDCGYVQQEVISAAQDAAPAAAAGTGAAVQSQNTFDAGVALYAGLAVLSLTGSTLVIRRKPR